MKKNKGMIIAFITPAVLMFCIIFLYPIIKTICMSFFSIGFVTDSFDKWSFVGIRNYVKLFTTKLFQISLTNLLKIWLIGGIIVMVLALLFAVILNSGIRFKKFFRAVIYMPNVVSAVALATMWLQYVYSPQFGMIKSFFEFLHLDNLAKVQWLSPKYKFGALLIAYCFGMVGYHMLIFSSGIEQISQDYYEAATLDGASKINQFRYITFPLLRGVIKTNITMWSVSCAAFFLWSKLFSTVVDDTTTITPMVYMYTQMFGGANYTSASDAGLASAVGVILSVFVVLVFWICNIAIKNDDLEL